ncbi:hypothetical protein C5Y96_02860 [Blastopirellula marina]|uniref:Methyltransferase FkbM domain-containing protein n=1 Tax=Blastopirellula marina TaxID=124 RepID=A0A2S8G2Z5_9BACT|nr:MULTISPECIES: FkbM family methyltransferase [Pirellulaceae]PQO38826.1 hypothetical protein C5Y96_02860 [Blastopirellula marina]RCS55134.1 FkbM family methyltransferase [Bremerella cremea]
MKVHRDRVSIDVALSPQNTSSGSEPRSAVTCNLELKEKKSIFRKIKDEFRRTQKRVSVGISRLSGGHRPIDDETNRAIAELQDANRQLQQTVALLQARMDEVQRLSSGNRNSKASNGILVQVKSGYVMCPPHESTLLGYLRESGDLERGTRLLIERILRPGDVFVDVGSHIGLHSVAAANRLQGRGKVYAFEPSTSTYAFLQDTVQANNFQDLVETFQCAVTDQVGEQRFYLAPIAGHQSLFPLYEEQVNSDNFEIVRTTPLDDALPAGTNVRLLKIDAEGAEILAVHGARQTIQASPNIGLIVEFGPSHLERTGVTAAQWFGAFEELQLVYRVIEPFTGTLEEWSIEQLMEVESANLLFARPDSDIWASAQ